MRPIATAVARSLCVGHDARQQASLTCARKLAGTSLVSEWNQKNTWTEKVKWYETIKTAVPYSGPGDPPQVSRSPLGIPSGPPTWFLVPTRVHTANSISIGLSVSAQVMVVTNRHTGRDHATSVAISRIALRACERNRHYIIRNNEDADGWV